MKNDLLYQYVRSIEKVGSKNLPIKISLPEKFLEEEVRCGYRISTLMKAVWAVEIDLYTELKRVCEKYGLRLYGDGGTVLGAVRHGGFIPWDDDMDLCMPRKDYVKLCTVAANEFGHPYFWQTEDTDPGTARGHGQLRNSLTTAINSSESIFETNHGIFIDVFPYDKVPDEKQERYCFLKRLNHLYNKKNIYRDGFYKVNTSKGFRKTIKNININLLKLISPKYSDHQYRRWDDYKCKYIDSSSELWANLYYVDINKIDRMVFPEDYYRSSVELQFEFINLSVPIEYEKYLEHGYGDWKTFIKGAAVHDGIIFDPYRPYSEYIENDSYL